MKKLILTLTALAISLPALAQDLPFVGERLFSMGDGAREITIKIAKNGTTTIKEHSNTGIATLYQGKYQTHLPIKYEGKITSYYQIKGDKVHRLNRQKQLATGCFACKSSLDDDGNAPCIADLEQISPSYPLN